MPNGAAILLHGSESEQIKQAEFLSELLKASSATAGPTDGASIPVDPAVGAQSDGSPHDQLSAIRAFLQLD